VLAVAEALERGAFNGPWARVLASAWGRAACRSVVRRLEWPARVRTVAVGGSTLGGSGKTPLAIACAAELAAAGARVALIGHGYRAAVHEARVVSPADAVAAVGDEALLAARLLAGAARVVVARRRADAIALAVRQADVLVLDGVSQTSPARASLALLAVDAHEPWGRAGKMPPAGDLRAPRAALLHACDAVVPLGHAAAPLDAACEVWPAQVVATGARLGRNGGANGDLRSWDELRALRVGLFAALARPERVVRHLAAHGVRVAEFVRIRDHGPLGPSGARECLRAAKRAALDLWVASPKCALHALMYDGPRELGAPLATLEHSVVLTPALRSRLRALCVP
jgi:tetraacyldisaccharide 4'-kinase